jgi:putative acetyltransferase
MGRHGITALRFVEDTLSGEEVQALVAYHLADMQRHSPACKVHALPVAALRQPDVTFWSAWIGKPSPASAPCGTCRTIMAS